MGDDIGVDPLLGESALTQFDEGLPKSPMRDRFLNDLGSVPNARTRSRDVSKSPMRERGTGYFDYDGVGKSPARHRNFSKSPIRKNETPERPAIGDDIGVKSPVRETDLTEFDGGFPKSPMRDRYLSDLRSVPNAPMRPTDVSRSPMRERVKGDFSNDGFGKLPLKHRNVSRSPIRESRVPISVRSRNVSRSPMRVRTNATGLDGVDKSHAVSMAGNFLKSPMRRGVVSEFDVNAEAEQEEAGVSTSDVGKEANGRKLTLKSSFSSWLTDNECTGESNDSYSGRKTWRDQGGLGVNQINEIGESVHGYDDGMTSEGSIDDRVHAINPRKKGLYRDRFKGEDVGRYATSRAAIDLSATQRDEVGVIHGNSKAFVEHGRMSASSSSTTERTSNYRPHSHGSYSEPRYSFESLRGPASLQDLEMERAELLRRYKELSEQVGDLDDRRISSSGLYSGADDYSEDKVGRFKARSVQQFGPARGIRKPAYFGNFSAPVCHMEDVYDFHPPLHSDPFSGQLTRGPHPTKQAHQFSKYIPGSVGARFDQDSPTSFVDETHYHHPSCSCPLCYADDWQGEDLPYSLAGRRSANLMDNPRSSHSMNLHRNSQRTYNSRLAYSTPLERKSHLGRHQRRGQLADLILNKHLCIPICGGAPFILCKGCFRLLKLPRKLMVKQKNQCRLQCGACSAVLSFDLQSKSLNFFSAKQNQEFVEAGSSLIIGLKELSLDDNRNNCDATSTNVGSCDFDAVGNSFQSMDSEASEVSKAQRSSTSLADIAPHLSPSSSHSSKQDRMSDNMSAKSSQPNSTEMPVKISSVPPPPGSPLRDLLDYSSHFRKLQAGDVANHTGKEKQEIEKDALHESPMQNTAAAFEMEVHFHQGPPTGFSQDEDVPKKEGDVRNNKDRGSSISGSMSPGRPEVYVNGQYIPQHLVKKAGKFAGTIEPGDYWYDSKAGFWGVMGHRCLGIIPPFIQEFGFPLPANCSGGDTTVHVNGRQLHKKDLNILESRGLPASRNKSYIIDISGTVLDGATKKFVVNLGKLAPTVQRKRRGFGMQVPEQLDDE